MDNELKPDEGAVGSDAVFPLLVLRWFLSGQNTQGF